MGEEDEAVTLEELSLDTAEMACRFYERTENGTAERALVDFLPLDDGRWVARVIPVVDAPVPVFVPDDSGAKETMLGAMMVLNQWLVVALASPIYKEPPKA
jgi:hypothetical protein